MKDIRDIWKGEDIAFIKFDPDDTQPTYIGLNDNVNASDSDGTWTIYKFVYSGSNITEIKKKKGAWSNRAGLF